MSRYIDADVVMKTLGIKSECANCDYADEIFFCTKGKDFVDACEAINDAPSIDIVFCEECEKRDDDYICYKWASIDECPRVKPNGFCSYGERGEP